MQKTLEVLFTPADFLALKHRDLSRTVCVVFDVLRATSSMLAALANGADTIIPVSSIPAAIAIWQRNPNVLLAGERDGLRIRSSQTGSIDFHLGNSPREFTADKIRGKTIAMTTTNGTRALQACRDAKKILIGSFSNLGALSDWIQKKDKPADLLLICAGTFEQAAYEDTLAAGALADLVWLAFEKGDIADSAQMAREIYLRAKDDLVKAVQLSRNARRLLANPDLRDDVAFCLQRDSLPLLAEMNDGMVRKATES
jgi:2-phosphosulfolactate phosphatase